MAGLGTGAAPFRAFLQHRALLASQGIPVGPTYYYFGSRHQSQEYLYGEEIEAFILDGTIARAGLAFSRDGPRKVYIQHKMREDGPALARMLWDERGVFYLCGPTWPVPDVYEALVDALKHEEIDVLCTPPSPSIISRQGRVLQNIFTPYPMQNERDQIPSIHSAVSGELSPVFWGQL